MTASRSFASDASSRVRMMNASYLNAGVRGAEGGRRTGRRAEGAEGGGRRAEGGGRRAEGGGRRAQGGGRRAQGGGVRDEKWANEG